MRRLAARLVASAGLMAPLALGGCAAFEAHEARQALLGMSAVDLQACAGIPSHIAWLDAQEVLFDYDYSSASPAVSLKFLDDISLSLGGGGGCHALMRIAGSRVVAVRYTATSGGMSGPDAACAPLVRACLSQPHAPPPPGYDARMLADPPRAAASSR